MLHIYRASAGSGKTFTLAYEYIKMLLGVKNPETGQYALNRKIRDRHRGILAVTFTNKATDEMKQRIVHELAVLGGMEPGWTEASPYSDSLCRDLHCSPEELRPAAAKALRCLLFDFNFFNVSTIDSFFQTVLRTFAREADISGNYEVDLDNDRAIGHGVRELFDSLSVDGNSPQTRRLLHWITQYLLSELSMGRQITLFNRSSEIHGNFLGFIKNISNDIFATHIQEMTDYLSDHSRLRQFSENIAEEEKSIVETTRSLCTEAIRAISSRGYDSGSLKVSHHLLNQLGKCAESGEETGTSATAMKVADNISAAFGKPLLRHLENNPDPDLEQAISAACESIRNGQARLKLLRSTRSNIFVLGLLERVYYHIEKYRADNNTIFLADTNSILREIIGDDDAPFVYERVGVWIRHFLIDEFQDTSRLQWENLRPLLHEGQSTGDDSLIIGDEKQCIYRFRFSDPTLLQHEVQSEFPGESAPHPNNSDTSTNWRSSADVVRFNNSLFRALADATGFTDIYRNVEQKVPESAAGNRGFIKIAGIDSPKDDEYRSTALSILTDDICSQLKAGYKASDICILTRFNSEGADVIAHLMQMAAEREELACVRIISDDAMYVGSAPAVRMIVSVMRFMTLAESGDNGSSGSGRPAGHRDRLREIGRIANRFQHLVSKGRDAGDALRDALTQPADGLPADTEDIAGAMACFNVPSLVERIISRYIPEDVATDQNMYISAFVDVVTDFCSRGSSDLNSFLSWWDDTGFKSRISAPFDENAIRVMTVHKSKGLEFKCVHIPFVTWKMVDFRDREWFLTEGRLDGIRSSCVPPMLPLQPASYMEHTQFAAQYRRRLDEQRLDELNVAYVAFTRAVSELCVCYRSTPGKAESYLINDLIGAAFDTIPELSAAERGDNAADNIAVRTIGSPTSPSGGKKDRRHTALQPGGSMGMVSYRTSPRDDLWSKLDIDRYLDYGLARDRGILLHDVLSRVHTASGLNRAVRRCSYRGVLPEEMAAEVSRHLQSQFDREEIRPWFSGFRRVACERPLVLADGSVRRPDRVVWTDDGHTDVIDYKFGEERPKEYARQVRAYMDALREMGCDGVRGFIWYVDSGKIVTV